jgi:hypothetical protein
MMDHHGSWIIMDHPFLPDPIRHLRSPEDTLAVEFDLLMKSNPIIQT